MQGERLSMSRIKEKELVRRTLDGDRDAFGSLFRTYQPRIYAAVRGRTCNRDDAEDLVQVTFMRAFLGLARFRGEAAFSTWLTQIAIHVCTTHFRAQRARQARKCVVAGAGPELREMWEPACGEDPEEVLDRKEKRDLLIQGIRGLPTPYREVMRLRYVEERSYLEITEELQVPIGTVKSWLYRARAQLKEAFEASGVMGD